MIGFANRVAHNPFNAEPKDSVLAVAAPSAVESPIVDNVAVACAWDIPDDVKIDNRCAVDSCSDDNTAFNWLSESPSTNADNF